MKTRCIKLLLILFTFPAFSQEKMTLTFEEAVNIGLTNNIELKKQNNQLIYNEKLEKSGMMSLGPSLNFRTQAWKTSGNQFIEQEARVVQDAKTNSVYGGFSANWTVFG
ncbi:MAG: hypothetical protein OEW75_14285, partial [Cyclobacteriaceae bacterium]|nr:hypothetical protein [Cyclobacteriaceae bacterium]